MPDTAADQIEPDTFEPAAHRIIQEAASKELSYDIVSGTALASIAISMRRIADALEKGATVVVSGDDVIMPEPESAAPYLAEEVDPACDSMHLFNKPCGNCWIPF